MCEKEKERERNKSYLFGPPEYVVENDVINRLALLE